MWLVFIVLFAPLVLTLVCMICLCPLLIIQAIRGCRLKPISEYPGVGILVPHFNEKPDYLLQSLNAIEKQDYPSRLTVLLVDDGSTNGIQAHLTEWLSQPRKQDYIPVICPLNHGSKGKVMDYALPYVPSGVEALVIVDSDTFLGESSVMRVVERLWQNKNCSAVCGFVIPANPTASLLGRFQYFEHIGVFPAVKCAQDLVGFVSVMAGAFVVHRMSAIKKVGGWGSWLVEDVAWSWSALAHGYRTGYAPSAVAYTYCPDTHLGLIKQRRRWARGRVEALRAVWKISPWKGLLLAPVCMLWQFSSVPLTLVLMAVLVIKFQQWWAIGLIGVFFLLYIALFSLYQLRLPAALRKGLPDILRSTIYNTLFELVVWRPSLLGLCDELFGKNKIWLTR